MEEIENSKKKLDLEWIQLIKEAKDLGITKEEIRTFLLSQSKN